MARGKVQAGQGLDGPAAAQLPAHHVSILQVPRVVTHRTPLAVLQHLHSALAWAATTHQFQIAFFWGWEEKGFGDGRKEGEEGKG